MIAKRAKELCGMLMIGDAVLAMSEPQRHILLWSSGPPMWERMMKSFARYPGVIRVLGAVELAAGLWMTQRQYEGLPQDGGELEQAAGQPALKGAETSGAVSDVAEQVPTWEKEFVASGAGV